MSLRTLPEMNAPAPRRPTQFDFSPAVLQRYEAGVRFEAEGANVINIFGVIGTDFWSDSVSPQMIERRLREIGQSPVVVNINSPGGDFWDGQAIFNMLRMHPAQVTTRVLGIAASAASVIAMAGDRIEMPAASWLMIHNTWTVAVGDRNALQSIADDLGKFDQVSADLYAARSGGDVKAIAKMMDAETFLSGRDAKDQGFADAVIDPPKKADGGDGPSQSALRRLESILQRAGMPRGERRAMIKELTATPSAGGHSGTPSATEESAREVADIAADLRNATAGILSNLG